MSGMNLSNRLTWSVTSMTFTFNKSATIRKSFLPANQDRAKKNNRVTRNTTEAEKGQSKNNFQIRKKISNRNIFCKSLLESFSNLKNYYKS